MFIQNEQITQVSLIHWTLLKGKRVKWISLPWSKTKAITSMKNKEGRFGGQWKSQKLFPMPKCTFTLRSYPAMFSEGLSVVGEKLWQRVIICHSGAGTFCYFNKEKRTRVILKNDVALVAQQVNCFRRVRSLVFFSCLGWLTASWAQIASQMEW